MQRLTRLFILSLLLLTGSSLLHGQTRVRAAHLLQDAPAITFYIDSATVAAPSLSFGGASGLVPVSAGEHRLTITGVGAPFEFAVIDTTIALSADSVYTLVLSGSFNLSITHALLISAPVDPTTDSASADVRFVNIALGLDEVNVEGIGGGRPVTVAGLRYGSASSTQRIAAGDLTVRLAVPLQTPFYRGRGYPSGGGRTTVFFTGQYDGSADRFAVVSIADNDTNEQIPLPAFALLPNEEGEFRAVHVAAGLGTLDLIRDGVVRDSVPIGFRYATRMRTDLLGSVRFVVSRSGEGTGAALATMDVEVGPDTATTVVMLPGDGGAPGMDWISLRRAQSLAPDGGRSLLRLVNASSDVGTLDITISRNDTTLFDAQGLGFKGSTTYQSIVSGEFALTFSSAVNYRFVGGYSGDAVLTAIINGRAADSSIAVNLLVESNPSEQEPMIFLTRSIAGGVSSHPHVEVSTTTILPQPVHDLAQIRFRAHRAEFASVMILNVRGDVVSTLASVAINEGDVTLPLVIRDLSSGVYSVVVLGRDRDPLATGKFVVER